MRTELIAEYVRNAQEEALAKLEAARLHARSAEIREQMTPEEIDALIVELDKKASEHQKHEKELQRYPLRPVP